MTAKNLSNCLFNLLTVRKMDQQDIAPIIGRTPTAVGAILKGQRCKPDAIQSLIEKFARDDKERAEILFAHLQDECARAEASIEEVSRLLNLHGREEIAAFLARGTEHVETMLCLSECASEDEDFAAWLHKLALNWGKKSVSPDWGLKVAEDRADYSSRLPDEAKEDPSKYKKALEREAAKDAAKKKRKRKDGTSA